MSSELEVNKTARWATSCDIEIPNIQFLKDSSEVKDETCCPVHGLVNCFRFLQVSELVLGKTQRFLDAIHSRKREKNSIWPVG